MYYRARYYDPGTGRFLQKDPEPGKLVMPITIANSYAYCGNNPINYSDPTGRFFLVDDIIYLAIAFAVVGATVGAYTNYNAARDAGLSGDKLLASTLLGAFTGATAGFFGAYLGAVGGSLVAGGASFVNNAGNQWIEKGDFSMVDFGRAAFAGGVSFGTSLILLAAFGGSEAFKGTDMFGPRGPGFNGLLNPFSKNIQSGAANLGSTGLGTQTDSGFGPNMVYFGVSIPVPATY